MANCYDCNRLYGDERGFPDLMIPTYVWRMISPNTKDRDGGLLCPSCICRRLCDEGIKDVPGAFMSGPIRSIDCYVMETLQLKERVIELEKENEHLHDWLREQNEK